MVHDFQQAGGNIARLSGLYHANQGPHTYFLRMEKVERWGGKIINLIHYEDGASLVFQVHDQMIYLGLW